ncbi:MAG: hypothetical protein ACRDP6_47220 [Actinoallomurus sp.]
MSTDQLANYLQGVMPPRWARNDVYLTAHHLAAALRSDEGRKAVTGDLGAARPEHVVKAEALREAADNLYTDDGPDNYLSTATWLRRRADVFDPPEPTEPRSYGAVVEASTADADERRLWVRTTGGQWGRDGRFVHWGELVAPVIKHEGWTAGRVTD